MRLFQIFDKINSFLKNVSNDLIAKKVDCIFPLNLHLIIAERFFVFHYGFQEKLEARNYLIWTADWAGEHNNPDTENTLIIFLSAIAVMQLNFWTEDNFYFISD